MARRPPQRIPLDDPRWIALKEAIEARQQQTGDVRIAVLDLETAMMRKGKLRAMRVDLATGKRARVERGFWQRGHELDVVEGTGSIVIFRRSAARPDDRPRRWGGFDHYPDVRLDGHVYFVWQPDLDALFGAGKR